MTATLWLALLASVLVLGALWVGRLKPVRPNRTVLTVTAALAGALTPVAAGIESPTDAELSLNPAALLLGGLLVVAGLGCALAAAPAMTTRRKAAALTWERRPGRLPWLGLVCIAVLVGNPVLTFGTLFVTAFVLPIAEPLPAMAGNPPVNDADEDVLFSIVGLPAGLLIGLLLAWANRPTSLERQRGSAPRTPLPAEADRA